MLRPISLCSASGMAGKGILAYVVIQNVRHGGYMPTEYDLAMRVEADSRTTNKTRRETMMAGVMQIDRELGGGRAGKSP